MGTIRRSKTKRRTWDLDQVYENLRSPSQLDQLTALVPNEDRPAQGQYHCVECIKYFDQAHNLHEHRRGKNHKRRIRLLKQEPYSQKEADAAAGIGCADFYDALERRKEQQRLDEEQRKMEIEP
jgi:bud site selection protein 20